MRIITAVAPVNIALIKYWGKRDEDLILPLNDSFSTTLNLEDMCAKTTVMVSPNFTEDKIWLNGKEENFQNPRLINCLKALKQRISPDYSDISEWKVHICSENNFPTAAGLASSSAGYACLVFALAALYKVEGDISAIARTGSGSACRSVFGGWVRWYKGVLGDGSDSIATPIFPADHWPEIRILVLVVNDNRKKYGSTVGMQRTVKTSELLKYSVDSIIPKRIEEIIEAIRLKDFETFATLTMRDSNRIHAVCLDTFPPCFYMNDTSHAIIEMIHAYNEAKGGTKVAYTFDAGPNACLYLRESNLPEVISLINQVFPTNVSLSEYYKGLPLHNNCNSHSQEYIKSLGLAPQNMNVLKYIIHTKVGEGPKLLNHPEDHLLDINGLPKFFT